MELNQDRRDPEVADFRAGRPPNRDEAYQRRGNHPEGGFFRSEQPAGSPIAKLTGEVTEQVQRVSPSTFAGQFPSSTEGGLF